LIGFFGKLIESIVNKEYLLMDGLRTIHSFISHLSLGNTIIGYSEQDKQRKQE